MFVNLRPCLWLLTLAVSSGFVAAAESGPASRPAPLLEMIPQPRQVQATSGDFAPATAVTILVTDTAEDRFAAALLRGALRETHGIDCNLASVAPARPDVHQLTLSATAGNDIPF